MKWNSCQGPWPIRGGARQGFGDSTTCQFVCPPSTAGPSTRLRPAHACRRPRGQDRTETLPSTSTRSAPRRAATRRTGPGRARWCGSAVRDLEGARTPSATFRRTCHGSSMSSRQAASSRRSTRIRTPSWSARHRVRRSPSSNSPANSAENSAVPARPPPPASTRWHWRPISGCDLATGGPERTLRSGQVVRRRPATRVVTE